LFLRHAAPLEKKKGTTSTSRIEEEEKEKERVTGRREREREREKERGVCCLHLVPPPANSPQFSQPASQPSSSFLFSSSYLLQHAAAAAASLSLFSREWCWYWPSQLQHPLVCN
jgi:hypothetical protein